MGLSRIEDVDLDNEKKSINELYKCSNRFKSVVFNSGAGSGKTYALIECLKYIISAQYDSLKNHNQKIVCITYTNVAAENVKNQLGNSDIVEISTIHNWIWRNIGNQKVALLNLHINKIKEAVKEIDTQLLTNSKYQKLDNISREKFFQLMIKNKKEYNMSYNLNAEEFKTSMPKEVLVHYSGLISNVSNFKGLVDKLFRKERYQECLRKIENGEKEFRAVIYDAMYNRDRLDKMCISHDTLLEYGYELIDKYKKMRQLIIDKYPYILIDEYQDTVDIVIKIMNLIEKYANTIKHNMFIAYFGDAVQNIYNAGIGNRLTQLHSGLVPVYKEYNRRSYCEVIDVANKIRNDEIIQKSIYSDCKGGSVKFYYGNKENIRKFIEKCEKKWNIQVDNPLHCMFATNQMVAEFSGFLGIYEAFKATEIYKGIGYEQLNSELLSHDIIRLGKVQAILYRLMKLYIELKDEKQPLKDIFSLGKCRDMSFEDAKNIISKLQSIKGNTLDELLVAIFNEYKISGRNIYEFVIERIFDYEELSYDKVLKIFSTSLYKIYDENLNGKEIMQNILNIRVDELLNWFNYIQCNEKNKICYHTFHGTKGLEYENVVIILGEDFGKEKGLFKNFFKNYVCTKTQVSSEYEKSRNILYVAFTRTIKNLRILYVDDFKEIQVGVNNLFKEAYKFSNEIEIDNF